MNLFHYVMATVKMGVWEKCVKNEQPLSFLFLYASCLNKTKGIRKTKRASDAKCTVVAGLGIEATCDFVPKEKRGYFANLASKF